MSESGARLVMRKERLEAFSDGVLAIIITITVLELRVPKGADLAALTPLIPTLLSYILSFAHVGIYWMNHHHMFQAVHRVNGRILWANMSLLFWLSLLPFATGWMGGNHFASIPVALYGTVLLLAGVSYNVLARSLLALHGPESLLASAFGRDFKGLISIAIYVVGVGVSFVSGKIGFALYTMVALLWIVPDRRIEKRLEA